MVSFDSHYRFCMVPECAEKTYMDVSCMYACYMGLTSGSSSVNGGISKPLSQTLAYDFASNMWNCETLISKRLFLNLYLFENKVHVNNFGLTLKH